MAAAAALRCALLLSLALLSLCGAAAARSVLNREGLPEGKRVLVTGGAGFIGYHLSMSLTALDNTVVALDNFNDYYDVRLKEARAFKLSRNNITVINGDICDVELLESLFEEHQFEAVVNLAAQAGVRYSVEHPHTYMKNNVDCFVNILEILRFRADRTKLVYASSSSVYGKGASIPFTEKECSDHPTNVYGASKRMNEMLAHAYHHLYDVSSTGLRFFTVYGPWGRPDMAPYIFTERISRGDTIDVYHTAEGNEMKRDFTYVLDIVDGIMRSIEKGQAYDVFNLGRGSPTSVPEFIGYIEKGLEKKAIKRDTEAHSAELPITFADTSHALEELKYEPQVSTEKGVHHFIEWYRWYQEVGVKTDFPTKDAYLPKRK